MTTSAAMRDKAASFFEIRLLGGAEVRRGGLPVTGFRSAKAQGLFYYLALSGRPVARTALVSLFWGDQAEEQARTNLNQTLSNLRKVLGDAIAIDRYTAAYVRGRDDFLDAEQLAGAAREAQQRDVEALLAAAALYRGELLAGFQVRDAAEFELWLQGERERLREAAVTVLLAAAMRGEEEGDAAAAEQALRALLRIEPWRESAHRRLMVLLARSGRRDAALAQYGACKQALAAALDVEPDDETIRLYQQIRSGAAGEGGRGAASALPARVQPSAGARAAAPPGNGAPPHNLAPEATPFVGRARELAEIVQCLADPQCRLLTLVGPGGIGKSRLAQQAALTLLHDPHAATWLADGIFFVALAAADSLGGVVAAAAHATGFQFYDNAPAQQQLLSFLHDKRMLLVLDNLEQLLTGEEAESVPGWLSEIAARAQHVKLLVTTREALGLQEAWFYPLAGLTLPELEHGGSDGEELIAALEESAAVQLFVQSARRARVGFSLSTTHAAVTRICRLVDGSPLGIELAAAWLKALTAEQIAVELARSLDILTARYANVPPRHHSMRAVCESSWQLLAQPLRDVMRRLALCRGGFRLEAAMQLAGASILDLTTLVEKSLLRQAETGRYEMHELLRQYALERLAARREVERVRAEHARYYLDFLQRRGPQLCSAAQRQAMEEVAEEQENIHQAWTAAVEARDWARIEPAQGALYDYLQVRSAYWAGQELFTYAAEGLQAATVQDAPANLAALRVRIRTRQGAFAFYLGDYQQAAVLVTTSLAEAEALGLAGAAAFALNLLGQITGWQGQRDPARAYLTESLRRARGLGDRAGTANSLHKLAQVQGSVGEYAEARQLAQESLAISRQLGRPDWIGYALDVLGWTTLCLGDYGASREHYAASLRLFQEIGDRLGTALALGGLGSVEWARGGDRLLRAAAYMTESLQLCRRIGHRHHAASRLWYLGQIAVEQGDYRLARAYAEEGKALAEEVGSRVFAAYNLCSLGEAAGGLGRGEEARGYLTSVLRIAGEVAHLPPLLIALIGLARLELGSSSAAAGAGSGAESGAESGARRRLALTSLATVAAHPACWQPYRERAQALLKAALGQAAGVPASAGSAGAAASLEAVVAAWQAAAAEA